ncbi:MAG TPA: hypothetical protein VIE43_27980 [Thermoanaerobaculia bacterium]|jgi:hypothetical protein|nr:hypothetical protein [Thermoanaerobaculia bacterium]
MLKLDKVDFICGRAVFVDSLKDLEEPTAKVFVKICLEGRVDAGFYAQLDTGAAWSVLDPVIAKDLGLIGAEGLRTRLNTRFGILKGNLIPLKVTFLAREGQHLDTFAQFFVSPDWPTGRTFLGYSGLLNSIRFALDPQRNHFYFGPGL